MQYSSSPSSTRNSHRWSSGGMDCYQTNCITFITSLTVKSLFAVVQYEVFTVGKHYIYALHNSDYNNNCFMDG